MFSDYLLNYYKKNLIEILEDSEVEKHFSIQVNFVKLFEQNTELGNNLLRNPVSALNNFDKSIYDAQIIIKNEYPEIKNYIDKHRVHIRIFGLPSCPEFHRTIFPKQHDLGSFLQVSGAVIRMTSTKLLEYQRRYICTKCKYVHVVEADYEQRFAIDVPKKCCNPGECNGKNLVGMKEIEFGNCKKYQEIKLRERVSKLSVHSTMWVTLEDDLVDSCKPGDDVSICGILMRRWKPQKTGKKSDVELVLRANHVQVNNYQRSTSVTPEIKERFRLFWNEHKQNPLVGRDLILKSFCPQLYGMYLAKLAVAMVIAGGSRSKFRSENNSNNNNESSSISTGVRLRSEPHLLLIGDPGTGKSHLLRFASKIIQRSILTTGIGSTSAGLTVAAVMEEGEWHLEAGALVLADEGICCIDEFSSMKESDRVAIHEAMEQQTISVAKASIVCKLNTRCSILAATNPKGCIDPSQPLSLNTAIASPLLSRFDVILLLRDTCDFQWDDYVCNHLYEQSIHAGDMGQNVENEWTTELLQAYYIVIKGLNPVLTQEANTILSTYYQAQRQAVGRNVARTTVRLLDSLIRLSQAHARLMFRSEVNTMDAVMAVALIESSMQGAALLLPTDVDTLHSSFPNDPDQKYSELSEIILTKLNLTELLNDSQCNETKHEDTNEKRKRNGGNDSERNTKRKYVNDLELLKMIPSVMDVDDLSLSHSIPLSVPEVEFSTEQLKPNSVKHSLINFRERFEFRKGSGNSNIDHPTNAHTELEKSDSVPIKSATEQLKPNSTKQALLNFRERFGFRNDSEEEEQQQQTENSNIDHPTDEHIDNIPSTQYYTSQILKPSIFKNADDDLCDLDLSL